MFKMNRAGRSGSLLASHRDMPMGWLFKIIPFFFVVVFVMIVAWYVFLGVLLVKGYDKIDEVGLKGAMESVWCGKQPNCKLPSLGEFVD